MMRDGRGTRLNIKWCDVNFDMGHRLTLKTMSTNHKNTKAAK